MHLIRLCFFLVVTVALAGCTDGTGGSGNESRPISLEQAMALGENPQRPEVIALGIGDSTYEVEVAGKGVGLNLGLMFRTSMGPDEGMWFEFPDEDFRRFWMRNTKIPLSIAFVDSKGRISNIEDMAPYDESYTRSTRKVTFALEMNRGWFEKKGIKEGDTIRIGARRSNPKAKD